jgi:hypothetical protein
VRAGARAPSVAVAETYDNSDCSEFAAPNPWHARLREPGVTAFVCVCMCMCVCMCVVVCVDVFWVDIACSWCQACRCACRRCRGLAWKSTALWTSACGCFLLHQTKRTCRAIPSCRRREVGLPHVSSVAIVALAVRALLALQLLWLRTWPFGACAVCALPCVGTPHPLWSEVWITDAAVDLLKQLIEKFPFVLEVWFSLIPPTVPVPHRAPLRRVVARAANLTPLAVCTSPAALGVPRRWPRRRGWRSLTLPLSWWSPRRRPRSLR